MADESEQRTAGSVQGKSVFPFDHRWSAMRFEARRCETTARGTPLRVSADVLRCYVAS